MNALVDDMLDMTVIEGGALDLDLEPLVLGDAITAAPDRLHRSSPDREVAFDAKAAAVEVLADWKRVGQIFDNLLASADRFGPSGTPLSVGVSHEEPGLVTVRVSDRGTGLGLPIVKGLVEAHAGTVAIEDMGGEPGATFRFTIPEAPGPA